MKTFEVGGRLWDSSPKKYSVFGQCLFMLLIIEDTLIEKNLLNHKKGLTQPIMEQKNRSFVNYVNIPIKLSFEWLILSC
jgi:hypothetical protein